MEKKLQPYLASVNVPADMVKLPLSDQIFVEVRVSFLSISYFNKGRVRGQMNLLIEYNNVSPLTARIVDWDRFNMEVEELAYDHFREILKPIYNFED